MLLSTSSIALPAVKHVTDCADYSLTVAPYYAQLQTLPSNILQHSSSLDGLKALYLSTNPLVTAFAFALLFLAPVFLIASEVNRNYSQVDRFWSILPTVFNAHYVLWAHQNGLPTQKLDNILAFSTVWSLRLTYNYWRKGGYSVGSEDYRWEIVRNYVNPTLFFIFNVLFISLSQSLLLWAITTPTYVLMLSSRITGGQMEVADIIFARVLMGLVLVEWFADQQQWNFQQAKKEYQATAKVPFKYDREDLDRGFCVSGLWSWSRHPNFAAEQSIWVALYQWGCYDTFTYFNWTFIGAMAYLLLFQSSTWLTEMISAEKYPEYKEYQQRVGKFLPKMLSPAVETIGEKTPVKKESASKKKR